jgi:hypothetical protein
LTCSRRGSANSSMRYSRQASAGRVE